MIRDRLEQDLPPLRGLLDELGTDEPEHWLEDAERAWVFDQAPVSAAPTRNVIGHVQVRRPRRGDQEPSWTEGRALVVGGLFVKRVAYRDNIARFLLRESVRFVHRQGRVALLEGASRDRLPEALPGRLGFTEVVRDGGAWLVCGPRAESSRRRQG